MVGVTGINLVGLSPEGSSMTPIFRAAFLLLLAGVLAMFCRDAFGASVPKPIVITVLPKVSVTNEYKRQTFHVRIFIPKHADNKLMSYSASCGSEIRSSEYNVDKAAWDWYEEFTVVEDCIFQACLHRAEAGKVKNYCDYQAVTTDALFDPP